MKIWDINFFFESTPIFVKGTFGIRKNLLTVLVGKTQILI